MKLPPEEPKIVTVIRTDGTVIRYNALNGRRIAESAPAKGPGMPTKLKNAIIAAHQIATSGMRIASREKRRARKRACLKCDFWNPSGNLGLGECKHHKCGCTKLKWYADAAKCPIGAWANETPCTKHDELL